jgi:hypothetical protein
MNGHCLNRLSQFNEHCLNQLSQFNEHCLNRLSQFNEHSLNRLNQFNEHCINRLSQFNEHCLNRLSQLNEHSLNQLSQVIAVTLHLCNVTFPLCLPTHRSLLSPLCSYLYVFYIKNSARISLFVYSLIFVPYDSSSNHFTLICIITEVFIVYCCAAPSYFTHGQLDIRPVQYRGH